MSHSKAFETKLNIYLSDILSEKLDIQSISETRKSPGRHDILIYISGVKIIIEGSYSKTDAEADIKNKMKKGFAELGIALHYKQKIPDVDEREVKTRLEQSRFDIRVFKQRDVTDTLLYYIQGKKFEAISIGEEWFEVNILDLAAYLKQAYESLIKEDEITATIVEIEATSNDFVSRLKSMDKTRKLDSMVSMLEILDKYLS